MRNLSGKTILWAVWSLTATLWGAELPNSGGKLDYGVTDLPTLQPITHNTLSPRTVTLLAALIEKEPAAFERARLASELGRTCLPQAIAPLGRALNDPHPSVRASAALAVAHLCSPLPHAKPAGDAVRASQPMIDQLRALLDDPAIEVRDAALRALGAISLGEDQAIDAVLTTPDSPLFATALSLAASPRQAQHIGQRLNDLPNQHLPAAIRVIARCKAVDQATRLAAMTQTDDIAQLVAIAEALGQLGDPQALDAVQRLLSHPHATVRRSAIGTLPHIAPPAVQQQHALKALQDTDPTVRESAADVLGNILTVEAVAPLIEQLSHEYLPLHDAARKALARAADEPTKQRAIEAAGHLLDSPHPRRREDGSWLLGQYRSDHRLQRHIELAQPNKEQDWAVIAQAAESLGLIGRQEATAAIVALSRLDGISEARLTPAVCNALIAGGRLGAKDVQTPAAAMLAADPMLTPSQLRSAGAFAIGAAGAPDSPAVARLLSVINSPNDGPDVRAEAIKAVGNLRLTPALPKLQTLSSLDERTQWLSEWAIARLTNQAPVHRPLETTWTTTLSAEDLSGR